MENNENNKNVTEEPITESKKKNNIVLIIGIIIFGLLMFTGGFFISKMLDSNSNKTDNNNTEEVEKEDKNKTEKDNNNTEDTDKDNDYAKININISEDEVKKLSDIYISYLNPMRNKCIKKSIDNNCLSDEEISNLVFIKLDEEKMFGNSKSISETDTKDYVSYDVFQQYVKKMFDIDNYKIPKKFNTKYEYCHKYTNTGENIERYTSGPGCSFGAHGDVKVDDWYYNYESYKVEGDIVTVTVVVLYQYNEDIYNSDTTNYTDDSKTISVDDYFDSRLTRLKYRFKYNDDNFTLISIESQ